MFIINFYNQISGSYCGISATDKAVELLGNPNKVLPYIINAVFNPHQNDQGRKGPFCFQRLIALKCLKCQKNKKISNPPLVSYLSNEPNFLLIK